MAEMTGTCRFCGQTRIIPFECTQEEADRYAAENCACDNNMKKRRQLCENIDQICGEECKQFGMDILVYDTIEELKQVGTLCVYGYIEAASFRVPDSVIGIKKTKDGVSVSRKKVSSVRLEA